MDVNARPKGFCGFVASFVAPKTAGRPCGEQENRPPSVNGAASVVRRVASLGFVMSGWHRSNINNIPCLK